MAHYLLGNPFELKTNHIGLRYIFTQPNLNARQRRWLKFLSEYDFGIEYIKGKEKKVADALSHRRHIIAISTSQNCTREYILQYLPRDTHYEWVKLVLDTDAFDS